MNATNSKQENAPKQTNDLTAQQLSPAPIVTDRAWSVKTMVPRLLIGAVLINIVPGFVATIFPSIITQDQADTTRNILNALFVVLFLIVIIAQLRNGGFNAKN